MFFLNVRKIQEYLKKLLDCPIRDPVKNFIAEVLDRMDQEKRLCTFSPVLCAAAMLNPSKQCRGVLIEDERRHGKDFIMKYKSSDEDEDIQSVQTTSSNEYDVFEQAFSNVVLKPAKQRRLEKFDTIKEVDNFLNVDSTMTVFEFFKSKTNKTPADQRDIFRP